MVLTLVRHGPTEWNTARRFQGRTDLPLSERGRADAAAVAAALRPERADRIFSSDLLRARQTAEAIAASRDINVVTDERLREFDFGTWEGLTWNEIVAREPHLAAFDRRAAKRYAPAGGESFDDLRARNGAFLTELAAVPIERAIVVTHAGALHAMLSFLGLAESEIVFSPGGISRIAMDARGAAVLALDDVRHLPR